MKTGVPHETPAGGRPQTAAADDTGPPPDGYAVSPAIGPLPAIVVSRPPGQASAAAQLRRALVRAVRVALGRASRRGAGALNTQMVLSVNYRKG
jgi:hypothetical protein